MTIHYHHQVKMARKRSCKYEGGGHSHGGINKESYINAENLKEDLMISKPFDNSFIYSLFVAPPEGKRRIFQPLKCVTTN
jgi:hypothetical protein